MTIEACIYSDACMPVQLQQKWKAGQGYALAALVETFKPTVQETQLLSRSGPLLSWNWAVTSTSHPVLLATAACCCRPVRHHASLLMTHAGQQSDSLRCLCVLVAAWAHTVTTARMTSSAIYLLVHTNMHEMAQQHTRAKAQAQHQQCRLWLKRQPR
jgi:hypothetical protein